MSRNIQKHRLQTFLPLLFLYILIIGGFAIFIRVHNLQRKIITGSTEVVSFAMKSFEEGQKIENIGSDFFVNEAIAATNCTNDMYPQCKQGTCSAGYGCRQDVKNPGTCKCIADSANTCKIQGYKVLMPGNVVAEPAASQTVTADGTYTVTDNPYFFTGVGAGSHGISVSVPSGYTVGYTVCTNDTTCHGSTPTSGPSWYGDCPADGYVDLWWHYTKCNKPGDANEDCNVDGTDYGIWFLNFGKNVSGGLTVGDFDSSGRVDGIDYAIWWLNFGT